MKKELISYRYTDNGWVKKNTSGVNILKRIHVSCLCSYVHYFKLQEKPNKEFYSR